MEVSSLAQRCSGVGVSNQVKYRPGPPRPPTTYRLPDVGFRRGRRGIWRPAGRPKGAPGWSCLTKLSDGLAPPDPQQPIGCWIWAISVAGVVFYVAGVVFGGQQAGPRVLQGAHV